MWLLRCVQSASKVEIGLCWSSHSSWHLRRIARISSALIGDGKHNGAAFLNDVASVHIEEAWEGRLGAGVAIKDLRTEARSSPRERRRVSQRQMLFHIL